MRDKVRLFVLVALLISCRSDGLQEGRAPGLAREMIVADGAKMVRSSRDDGFEQLAYIIEAPFPAADIITSTADKLAQLGWQPARNQFMNSSYASEYLRGWTQSTVVNEPGGKERFLRQWSAQWSNDAGDIVSYSFLYLSPEETPSNTTTLDVQAQLMNKAVADTFRRQFPPENTSKPLVLLPRGTPPNTALATDNSPDPHAFMMRRDSD